MENETNQNSQSVSQQQMLLEIYEFTRKTKNYMKWQLIITVAFVILPLVAMMFVVPLAMRSLGSAYGLGGDGGSSSSLNANQINDLIK